MSDTTILRSSAIVRNASVGTTLPHGPVKTGELPLVQVKMTTGGPQVQGGQQKPVAIVPSKNASPVTTGALPLVQVKMTQNGPQLDDGQDRSVVIRDGKQQTVAAGALPMVQVRMENGRPTVQSMPNVQAGPPQIPTAAPAVSQPRGVAAPQTSQGLPRAPHVQSAPPQMVTAPSAMGQPRVARIAAPTAHLAAPRPAPVLPEVPELTTDQWMLCRHVVDAYLKGLSAETPPDAAELPPKSDAVALAEATIQTIDDVLVAIAVRAEAAALAAAPAVVAAPTAPSTGFVAPAASGIPRTMPTGGYVARRPGSGLRSQGNATMGPRRVSRPASPLPPVIVNMENNRPVVQQEAAAEAPTTVPSVLPPTETPAVAAPTPGSQG